MGPSQTENPELPVSRGHWIPNLSKPLQPKGIHIPSIPKTTKIEKALFDISEPLQPEEQSALNSTALEVEKSSDQSEQTQPKEEQSPSISTTVEVKKSPDQSEEQSPLNSTTLEVEKSSDQSEQTQPKEEQSPSIPTTVEVEKSPDQSQSKEELSQSIPTMIEVEKSSDQSKPLQQEGIGRPAIPTNLQPLKAKSELCKTALRLHKAKSEMARTSLLLEAKKMVSTGGLKKAVSFSDSMTVVTKPKNDSFNANEVWYNYNDYDTMLTECFETISWMKSIPKLERKQHPERQLRCMRGLEEMTASGQRRKIRNMKIAWHAVLKEQARQRSVGVSDPAVLSDVYVDNSFQCIETAFTRAVKDCVAVHKEQYQKAGE